MAGLKGVPEAANGGKGRNVQDRGKVIQQAAVLAMRNGQICLITSSSGKHWLVPKGHLEHGLKLRETARQEAWEEAGLIGVISPRPVGAYEYQKFGRIYRVVIFWMQVTHVQRKWPEQKRRRRRWLSPEKALPHISHSPLRRIVDAACRPRPWVHGARRRAA
jgi:8-oxo-dGTP pyrophosphatase MutT (NUDIX family)